MILSNCTVNGTNDEMKKVDLAFENRLEDAFNTTLRHRVRSVVRSVDHEYRTPIETRIR